MRLIDWHENMFNFLTPLFINGMRMNLGCTTDVIVVLVSIDKEFLCFVIKQERNYSLHVKRFQQEF
jgi:hypothetical protein